MRHSLVVLIACCACAACANGPASEQGVNVFSADTSEARIMVDVSGSLEVGLRADRMLTTRDQRLVMETPVTLIFQRGTGDVIVHSVDSTQRIVLEPVGTPPDSGSAGATGVVVTATRVAGERLPRFRVERP